MTPRRRETALVSAPLHAPPQLNQRTGSASSVARVLPLKGGAGKILMLRSARRLAARARLEARTAFPSPLVGEGARHRPQG